MMDSQGIRSLTILSEAGRMLAEAKTLEDVRQIRSLAVAAQAYAKAHELGEEARNRAGAVVVEADILGGQILEEMAENGERDQGKGGDRKSRFQNGTVKLADLKLNKRQSKNAQDVAAEADGVRYWMTTAREITPRRAARVARDLKAKREREAKPPPVLPALCDLRLGDFREVLADVPNTSIDVILTDPPYPRDFLPLWSGLATFAKRVLKPSGMLVAMSGQTYLPEVMDLLGTHLSYRWTIALLLPGAANVVHARRVHTAWKPVLVYGSSERRLVDIVQSDAPDKGRHPWGQSETGFAKLLDLVAEPGAIICDPFVGGGTTPLVALAAGCPFIGAEIDPDAYRTAQERLR